MIVFAVWTSGWWGVIVFQPAFVSKMGWNYLTPKMASVLVLSGEEQSHNSDKSDTDREKSRKAIKCRKLAQEKWSGSLICKLIDETKALPCLVERLLIRHHGTDLGATISVYNFMLWETRHQLATQSHRLISATNINYHEPFERRHDSQW